MHADSEVFVRVRYNQIISKNWNIPSDELYSNDSDSDCEIDSIAYDENTIDDYESDTSSIEILDDNFRCTEQVMTLLNKITTTKAFQLYGRKSLKWIQLNDSDKIIWIENEQFMNDERNNLIYQEIIQKANIDDSSFNISKTKNLVKELNKLRKAFINYLREDINNGINLKDSSVYNVYQIEQGKIIENYFSASMTTAS